jgi:hypothetical protein
VSWAEGEGERDCGGDAKRKNVSHIDGVEDETNLNRAVQRSQRAFIGIEKRKGREKGKKRKRVGRRREGGKCKTLRGN